MGKGKKESFFWTSYSDMMSSLFFVMLVLFILTISLLHKEIVRIDNERRATQEQLDQIERLNKSIEHIDSKYFDYDEKFKRHTLKDIVVSFNRGSSDINNIPEEQRKQLVQAGYAIRHFITTTTDSIPEARYLLIIEGQSSKDDYVRNYELSYERALSLVKLWSDNHISFDNEICELIISGSGQNSAFRVAPDNRSNQANQRFVIHIIPKPGVITSNRGK